MPKKYVIAPVDEFPPGTRQICDRPVTDPTRHAGDLLRLPHCCRSALQGSLDRHYCIGHTPHVVRLRGGGRVV